MNASADEIQDYGKQSPLEYGMTRPHGQQIVFSPATRVGNVTRVMDMTDIHGKKGESMLELSFPALRGASGSPVVCPRKDFELWGVVVSNASYHLLPVQTVTDYSDEDKPEAITHYMLPQALAVNVRHLRALAASLTLGKVG